VYDLENAEICTAAARNIGANLASDRILLRIQDIKSNKIARQTLRTMVIIGALTLLYQFASLFPAFQGARTASRGLEVQVQGAADTRQSLAYSFISECMDRKVWALQNLTQDLLMVVSQSQDWPLGPDCVKYLTRTPKAPPDINKWMIEPPWDLDYSSPARTSATRRDIKLHITRSAPAVVPIMDQKRLRKLLEYGVFVLGSCSGARLLSAFQWSLIGIFTGILTIPVSVWFLVQVSSVVRSFTSAGIIFLFAMISSVVREGRIYEVFVSTGM
jgi:hypothetical protein